MLNIVSAVLLASFNLGSFVEGSVNEDVGTTGFRELTFPQVLISDHFDGFAAAPDADIADSQRSIPIDLEPSVGQGAAGNSRSATVIIESLSGTVHLIATESIN